MKLYSYWRSGTSYRTRIALELKAIDYEVVPVNLRKDEQNRDEYRAINAQGLVPALVIADGTTICQSPAIIEYLEEIKPRPSLLPLLPEDKATVRAMAAVIGCDTHPLNNLRILKYLKHELGQEQEAIDAWAREWIARAFTTLEHMAIENYHGGDFCFGDTPTMADCYLVPQIYSARRFEADLKPYPRLLEIDAACARLTAFKRAHPDRQPDAD